MNGDSEFFLIGNIASEATITIIASEATIADLASKWHEPSWRQDLVMTNL